MGFADNRCGTEFGSNVLATTLTTLSCTNPGCTGKKDIVEADIVFNANENWDIYRGPLLPQTIEFERVALHELGHALGLDHESSAIAIMQPFASNIATLQPDDISGANVIYGGTISTPSIYGIPIKLPSKTSFSGPDDVINFAGTLATSNANLENKFIDIYQFEVTETVTLRIELTSSLVDTVLMEVDVLSDQQLGSVFLRNDDSKFSTDSRIEATLSPGSYWMGATSFSPNDFGDYQIQTSVVPA